MKIIYVTTTIDADDYKSYVSLWSKKPNPSNQNFHNKVIRSLAINNELEVISIRPFSRKLVSIKSLPKVDKVTGNIKWHYLPIKGNKFNRFIKIKKDGVKALKKSELAGSIILADTININCMNVATRLGKIGKVPVIGICTDSPSNITGTLKSYTKFLLKKATKLDGYITLTEELNTLFNDRNKPHIVIEGIVENNPKKDKNNGEIPYFFFGGSLLPRYGINELIDGFSMLNRNDVKLIIAGHSGSIKFDNPNIEFVGTLDNKDVLAYESNALANINPRPYSEDLDRFSIPSKTLEYLSSGVPTISVRNSKLNKYFKDEIIWINNSSKEEIKESLEHVLNMSEEERNSLGIKAKEKVLELYSLDQFNHKVTNFISTFLKD